MPLILLFLLNFSLFQVSTNAEWIETEAGRYGYLISGGFVSSNSYEKDRYEAATCRNCHWLISSICESWDDENHGWCPYMVNRCPADEQISEVFRANASARPDLQSPLWRRTGYTCVGAGGPLTSSEILNKIQSSKYLKLPDLVFQTLPPKNALVNLKFHVKFISADELADRKIFVAGIPVTVRATATRDIKCAGNLDCQNLTSRSLIYLEPGLSSFRVQARWFGSFDALGLFGVPLDENAIIQSIHQDLKIFEIHRRLLNERE